MIAGRWAGVVLALLLTALVPTILHTYADWRDDSGRPTSELPVNIGEFVGQPAGGDNAWLRNAFAPSDWLYRRYTTADGSRLQLVVARSYDPKRLYHHPEKAIPFTRDMSGTGLVHISVGGDVPVHMLASDRGASAAYVLLSGGTFVADPVRFQVEGAARALIQPRRPMTLFLAYDPAEDSTAATFGDSRKGRLLRAAIGSYLSLR